MERLTFVDVEVFACAVADKYDELKKHDNLSSLSIVGTYNEIKDVLRELICIGYDIGSFDEFGSPEVFWYEDEYILSLINDEIWVEKLKGETRYKYVNGNVVYLFDDCNSKIISKIQNIAATYEVSIDENCTDDYYEPCCDYAECVCEEYNDDQHGFTATFDDNGLRKTISLYCTDKDVNMEYIMRNIVHKCMNMNV